MRIKIVIIVCLWSVFVFGQGSSTYVPKIIPSSPETAKFNQFIDTPVGYNTGMPNININLSEISIDGVNVPISLSYHTDGIKVDEKATWVGLGWNLDAGYKVSRKENGLPDESRFFWQVDSNSLGSIQGIKNYSDNNPISYGSVSSAIAINLAHAQDKNSSSVDLRPDEFNYSTASSNAKFMFSQQNQKFITFPLNMDKIDINYQTDKINNIKIIDDYGIKYFYGIEASAKERTNPLTHDFYTTWNISKIENIKSQIISFNYNLYSLQNYEKPISNLQDLSPFITNDQQVNLESSYISEINYPEGKIEFITETNREDLKQFPKLHSIIFKNNKNQIIKTIIFNYSYFTNNTGTGSSDNFTENSGKRLKLNSIDIYDNINSEKQTYSFSYYENNIPDRLIGGGDYWGYYNGSIGNNIPSYVKYGYNPTLMVEDPNVMVGYYTGANKNINPQTFNAFLLKDITYPTGAKQEYVYETNFGKLSNNKDQIYFCLANKYLPINQNLTNYYFSISGLFGQNYTEGIYFGNPLPAQTITLNQNEKKYIFRKSFPINNGNIKSIGTLYTNSLSHNFNKATLGVTNSNLLNMNIEEKRYLIKNGVKTLIYNDSNMNTGLSGNVKPIYFYGSNLLVDNYDTFEIEISFIYNNLIAPQLNNVPFYFNYNFDDVKRDFNQPYNNNVYIIGGARVKEINSKDNNSQIKKRTYKYSDDFSESGLAYFVPNFSERRVKYNVLIDNFCGITCGFLPTNYWSISSQGIYNTSNGSNVAYQNIEEQIYGSDNSYLGKTTYEYYLSTMSSDNNFTSFQAHPYSFINTYDWVNKSIKTKKIFNSVDNINPLLREDYEYFFKKSSIPDSVDEIRNDLINDDIRTIEGKDCLNSIFFPYNYASTKIIPYFKHFVGFSVPKTKITTEYFNGNPVTNTITYNYNFNGDFLQLTNQSVISSTNQNIETKYYYSNDLPLESNMANMVAANRIGEAIRTESYENGIKLSQKDTKFGLFPSDIAGQNLILPQYIYAGKENSSEKKITFNSYDTKGNITQYTQESGVPISIIWGYNKTQPVAKLENISYSSIPSSLITAIQNATDSPTGTEAQVVTALNAMRASTDANLQKAMITTLTYKPLVGVLSMTDPKGETQYFSYDNFGRLQYVKDTNGKILSENEYHYRP